MKRIASWGQDNGELPSAENAWLVGWEMVQRELLECENISEWEHRSKEITLRDCLFGLRNT